jgi:hypothetical protein
MTKYRPSVDGTTVDGNGNNVDAFQIIAANSMGHTGAGITVYTYANQVMDKAQVLLQAQIASSLPGFTGWEKVG